VARNTMAWGMGEVGRRQTMYYLANKASITRPLGRRTRPGGFNGTLDELARAVLAHSWPRNP